MQVVDKKSYTLYPLTSYTAGANRRDLYEEVPSILKAHVESTIPFPDQEFEVTQSEKFNLYELDEIPTEQELLFDTKDELIAKLEEWGFEWKDFAEKICYFPYNSNENVPTSNKFARGWVKDISPVWSAWENLGIGKSWRATSGTNITLTMDDQYYGKTSDLITYPMEQARSIKNIYIRKPVINVFALSNKPLAETKHIWTREFMLKTDAETPGAEDVFSSYLTAATVPEFGSSRSGSGQGNSCAGYNTGITASLERGRAGFAIPILFYVNNPEIQNVNKIYGLIYFGYVQRNNDGEVSNQKYFIMTRHFSLSVGSYDWYYIKNSTAYADINEATAKIDEFFGEAEEWTDDEKDYEDLDINPGTGDYGNPYEELKNNSSPNVVGGDYDLINHIYDIDDTPNTAYEQFIASTSFFGSYRLSLQNLKNYAESLKLLYDHSTEIAIGSAYSGYANRITEGTVSLFMIPFSSFSSSDYQNEVFAVGGSGIKSTDASWSDYIWGRDGAFDTAQLLNTYTKRWTIDLDPIIRKYDNFLDFAPYSKASIFIPYVGQFELPINLIQSAKNDEHKIGLRVKFGLNVSNGDIIAIFEGEIKNSDHHYTYTPLATWTGNCARAIKLAVNDDSQAIREGVRAITSMVSFAASGGASAGFMASQSGGVSNTSSGSKMNIAHSSSVSESANKSTGDTGSIGFSGNASSAMPNSITPGQHLIGGATTAGELGWLGVQQIVVKVERPIWWLPADYADLFGYPTKRYTTLRKIHGFATVSRIHLRCSATGPEKEEIERLLSEGVLF